MKTINNFISEKLKVSTKRRSGGDISVVRFLDFLLWFYDVDRVYDLSMDFINEQSDVLYQIEEYYGTSTVSAYKFLMGHKEDELEIQTKGKPGNYEFLVILKKGNNSKYCFILDTKDILVRFYKDEEIPDDIKL
jgi:hypothetical protein